MGLVQGSGKVIICGGVKMYRVTSFKGLFLLGRPGVA